MAGLEAIDTLKANGQEGAFFQAVRIPHEGIESRIDPCKETSS